MGACSGIISFSLFLFPRPDYIYHIDLYANVGQLREVKFRGVVSAAMVYDLHPIIDHFRLVTPTMVAGAMDTKVGGELGTYYFYLTKEGGRL